MQQFSALSLVTTPPLGWVKTIRDALQMTAKQLATKLSVTRQGIYDLEHREKSGAITIKTLREVAKVLDMNLVYGFVPNDGSLELLVERRAMELAKQIVLRSSQSMRLEGQENSDERIEKAIRERAEAIVYDDMKSLWD